MASPSAKCPWVEMLANDDEIAFEAVYQQYHHAVFANIFKLVKNQVEAEDILQEVFVALWESRHQLKASQTVPGWLFYTSYYKSLQFLRKALKQPGYLDIEITEMAEEKEDDTVFERRMAVLNSAIDLLPPRKRKAFRLCRVEGKSYEEVAEALDISCDSVKDYVKTSSVFIRKYVLAQSPGMSLLGIVLTMAYLP